MRVERFFALLMLLLLVSGCSSGDTAEADDKSSFGPPAVSVAKPLVLKVRDSTEFTGRTEAKYSVDIMARVSGYLQAVNFEDGDDVKAGQVLFQIDPGPYKATLEAAQAEKLQAEAKLRDAEANLERTKILVQKGAKTQQDLDLDVANRDVSKASVEQAQANIDAAELNVQYCDITTEIDGMASKANFTKGNLVSATVPQVLTTVKQFEPEIYVYFDVDEPSFIAARRDLLKMGKKLSYGPVRDQNIEIEMSLGSEEDFSYQGVIDFVNNTIDPATGTIRVRAVIKNPETTVEGGNIQLAPGMFCTVRVLSSEPVEGLFITERAIGIDQGQRYVFLVKDGKAQYRAVELGMSYKGLRMVKESSGITADDEIVVDGIQRVRDGSPVTITPDESGLGMRRFMEGTAESDAASDTSSAPESENN